MFQRILLPTDLSANSFTAFAAAADLASALRAEIILAHVTPTIVDRVDYGHLADDLPSLEQRVRAHVLERLEGARAKLPQEVPVRCEHRIGNPTAGLRALADELEVDLVIIASHGFSGHRYQLLGSVAEALVRHAPCPVMTIRAED